VIPSLPENLKRLNEIAFNLWWTWEREAIQMWSRIDFDLWDKVDHNPVALLGAVTQSRLKELDSDDSFLAHLERVAEKLESYMTASTWFSAQYDNPEEKTIAYFSFEYGLSEGMPIYSGGLGVLSGDHLKSASELGLPLIGVGLLYRRGYFHQYLNTDGWQQEFLPDLDFHNLPVRLQTDDTGRPLRVEVKIGKRPVSAYIWKVQVGRVPLYLLDTNLDMNHPADRELTSQLYGGDTNHRISQEILLGIGGRQALKLLKIEPAVCHMNEGHAAFLGLERIRELVQEKGLTFEEARLATSASNVFTTHTPVPAGNDRFPVEGMETFFSDYYKDLGISWEKFLSLGRENEHDPHETFCMTVLALKLSAYSNGVSQLHGEVSRQMWRNIWPDVNIDEVPITSITNGIHIRSWISMELAALFDRYLGERWWRNPVDASVWERVKRIPDAELWRVHQQRSSRLVAFCRKRLREQFERRGLTRSEIQMADEALDPDVLTIGFARRFATYKRGNLLFRDPERLARILTDPSRPVQIIFAGKAHPADHAGKEIIREINHYCRGKTFFNNLFFIEDYDMNVARYLTQGVDVWLNTPRRPHEASGTSGMKAAANGVLNLSILDGWWVEGYQGDNGWAIGSGEDYDNSDYQDSVESQAIYEILEKDIVPLFYERGRDGLPRGWIERMKKNLLTNCPVYNTNRMLREYSERFYFPAAEEYLEICEDDYSVARQVAAWEKTVRSSWDKVSIVNVVEDGEGSVFHVGEQIPLRIEVDLGDLSHEDVSVEVYYGPLDTSKEIRKGKFIKLQYDRKLANGHALFQGSIKCETSGGFGFSPRVVASHSHLPAKDRLHMLKWG
jgi:starch phosphorylase